VSFGDLLLILRAALNAALLLSGLTLVGLVGLPRKWRSFHPLLLLAQCLSLGITILSLLSWIVGSLFGTQWLPYLLGAAAILALSHARGGLRLAGLAARKFKFSIFLILLPAIVVSIPSLLLPIIDSDGLRYHLALPKLYLMLGKIFLYPWDSTGAYPQAAEMLYMIGMHLGPAETAKWLHFAIVLFGALLLTVPFRRSLHGYPAVWVFLAIPVVLASAPAAFIEGFIIFPLALALLLIERKSSPWAIGLAFAAAAWAKYTAIPALIGLSLLSLVRARPQLRLRTLAALCLPTILVLSPMAIRNFAATGDPLYPVLGSVLGFEQPEIDGTVDRTVSQRHSNIPGPLGIPWGQSLGPVEPDEIVGWHLLPLLLLLPLYWKDRRVASLGAMGLPYLVLGFWIHPSMRLAIPFLWALAALTGPALAAAEQHWGRNLGIAGAAMIMIGSLPYYGKGQEFSQHLFFPYLRGDLSRQQVVEDLVPGAEAAEWINRQAVAGKVMALDFPAPFLFDRPWVAEGLYNRPPLTIWLNAGNDAAAIMEKLRNEEIRFILVTPGYGGGRLQSLLPLASSPVQEEILIKLRSHLRLRYRRDGIDIWEVEDLESS